MKIKVTKRGTHMVPLSQINADVPSPGELVMECLRDYNEPARPEWGSQISAYVSESEHLMRAIVSAEKQGWEFETVDWNRAQLIELELARLSYRFEQQSAELTSANALISKLSDAIQNIHPEAHAGAEDANCPFCVAVNRLCQDAHRRDEQV